MSIRRVKMTAPGELRLETEEKEIALKEGMVKVRVSACGVCGSDLALLSGKRDFTKELYFGHELSGVVTEVSEESCGVRPGMRVASELSATCGKCWNCRNGLAAYCRNMNDALLPGGFTETTLVRSTEDYSFLTPVPDSVDDITAALLEPMNCACRIAMKAEMRPGDSVAVFGLGAMGVITAIILKRLGAGKVIGLDRSPARMAKVRAAGIFDAVLTNDDEGISAVRDLCGEKGPDVTVEATGVPAVFPTALQLVRPGGRVVVGSVYSGSISEFDPLPIFRKELTVVGAKGPTTYRRSDGSSAVMCMMEQAQEELKKIITVYDYKDALRAFEDARSGEAIKAVIRF